MLLAQCRFQELGIVNAIFRIVFYRKTSVYATWFTAGGAIRMAHYDVIVDVITRKL